MMQNSMVKNFAHLAHLSDPVKPGMVLFPKVTILLQFHYLLKSGDAAEGEDENGEEGKQPLSEAEIRKNKLAKLLNSHKPEADDGDIENFYSFDPSKSLILKKQSI